MLRGPIQENGQSFIGLSHLLVQKLINFLLELNILFFYRHFVTLVLVDEAVAVVVSHRLQGIAQAVVVHLGDLLVSLGSIGVLFNDLLLFHFLVFRIEPGANPLYEEIEEEAEVGEEVHSQEEWDNKS